MEIEGLSFFLIIETGIEQKLISKRHRDKDHTVAAVYRAVACIVMVCHKSRAICAITAYTIDTNMTKGHYGFSYLSLC